ncbi:hypothetical protein FHS29_003587 [Saccharothrix tamanrassetensis]|uniref:Transposase n=1 Tax=Saccharothrix tamanrassetensis TaxID=1051531 RepID=A0A841CKV1_9PSEU|nr:hypothetical protein [Saccharothrix tamanrassetensis]MBB5956994.1 hypothetical protein [Saccharothrix tamanrassetensis]
MDTTRTDDRLTEGERAELVRLRSENTFLRAQRDELVRIATGYAHDMDAMLRRHHRPTDHSPPVGTGAIDAR